MPAYVVAQIHVTDPEALGRYAAGVQEVTERLGGRYLFAGPGSTPLEGEPQPDAMAIIEFPSAADARRWYESAEYAPLKELRQSAGSSVFVLTPDTDAAS
jgi:uncharacterized protein (DUF1330 family)